MIYLSNSAVEYAISISMERENYEIIVCVKPERLDETIALFERKLCYEENLYQVLKKDSYSEMHFKNGSSITIITTKCNPRKRCDQLIVDRCIERSIIDSLFIPCESLVIEKRGEFEMKIPGSVRINGVEFTVKYVENLNNGSQICYGHIDYDNSCIELSSTHGAEHQKRCQVLWHEILHGIREENGLIIENEEAIVDMFAKGIYQVLQDNGGRFFDLK